MKSSFRHAPRAALTVALVLLVIVATLLLAACGGTTASSEPSAAASAEAAVAAGPTPPAGFSATPPAGAPTLTAEEQAWLAERGTLQVGAFNDYPPFCSEDADGNAVGIAVDFWKLMAYRLGVQAEFHPVLFSEQLDGLKKGTYDSLTGIFPLPERKQWFGFSKPYFIIDTRIFTDASHTDADTLKKLKGLKVAVVKDDSGQQLADAAGLDTLVVDGYPQAVKAVGSGDAQALILDEPVGVYYVRDFGLEGKVKAVGSPVASGLMTLPVRKDDEMLLQILDKGVYMVGDGEFESIYESNLTGGL